MSNFSPIPKNKPRGLLPFTSIPKAILGDTNVDGVVDLADLNNIRNHFGEGVIEGPPVFGEAYPYDGRIDLEDLDLARNYFGASQPQPIPEPSSLGLFIVEIMVIVSTFAGAEQCRSARRAIMQID
ncbi:MAG: hypothetical protein L0Y72_16565 [Gemmataceae bacterium]|nr:hypothetical protein [Gemmataceae bacterium]